MKFKNIKKSTFPISYCENGKWVFIEDFEGTYPETLERAKELQEKDENKNRQYRIWDDR